MDKTFYDILCEHSPYTIQENACVKRAQIYFDTGYYPEGEFSKTWDILAWCDAQKLKSKNIIN